jgi:hypothetical protein
VLPGVCPAGANDNERRTKLASLPVSRDCVFTTCWRGDTMAKGQEKPVSTNKPKLTIKEKQAKKKEKKLKK